MFYNLEWIKGTRNSIAHCEFEQFEISPPMFLEWDQVLADNNECTDEII